MYIFRTKSLWYKMNADVGVVIAVFSLLGIVILCIVRLQSFVYSFTVMEKSSVTLMKRSHKI